MTLDTAAVREKLRDFDLTSLFVEHLGWDRPGPSLEVSVDEEAYSLRAVAEKRGVQVFECTPAPPDRSTRQKIEREVGRSAREHLIVFSDQPRGRQVWQWVSREPDKPAALREHEFFVHRSADLLIQKLDQLRIPLAEDEDLRITGVVEKLRKSFDKDRVTKKFYDRFKQEHQRFLAFIEGIREQGDREWYASLMLNRLMFIYFIQKKGFLDGDRDYLRDRLRRVQAERGQDSFLSFYRYFLKRLFHEGLGAPEDGRAPDLDGLLGRVPYLNGGLFDVHQLEEQNPEVDVPDEAFEELFDFFDAYEWHLDDRPLSTGNEINPDVLGYIFEKYINQKQMGAYYTKEDITEYIAKNTIVPFLLDSAAKDCAIAFKPEGSVWRLLRDDPDAYIYPSVLHGVDEPPPPEIAAGIDDIAQRQDWNRPAPAAYALPTETWREHIARRQRCLDIRAKLAAGDVSEVNDLVTLNLNIRQFIQDVIERCEGPELLRACFKAIEKVTVLDPTCGSGAFLFAALNILQPLYDACLERMDAFVSDLEVTEPDHHPEKFGDFRRTLAQVAAHPNRDYFILKSIVLNNLYGVDIMEEAVEICKLRLFLKLVAQLETYDQVEPLPDIDFNIRAGNTLVGFANYAEATQVPRLDLDGMLPRVEEGAELAARAFERFREMQVEHGVDVTKLRDAKAAVRSRLFNLSAELDRHLASQYGVDPSHAKAVQAWRLSHQPFHWFVDFHEIISGGGFHVVIGNPPYLAANRLGYTFECPADEVFPDIYANVLLRSVDLCAPAGRCSMIVPLSLTFGQDYASLRGKLGSSSVQWVASFDNIPAAIFTGVSQRCTIWTGKVVGAPGPTHVAPMHRWRAAARPRLTQSVEYFHLPTPPSPEFGLPKLPGEFGVDLLDALARAGRRERIVLAGKGSGIGFSPAARNFVSVFIEPPPNINEATGDDVPVSQIGLVPLESSEDALASLAALASDTFFWYWMSRGDGFHVTGWLVRDFLGSLERVEKDYYDGLVTLGEQLHDRRFAALQFKKNAGRYVGNFNYRHLPGLTTRASLVLLAGLRVDRQVAARMLSYVERVLSINEFAGEKAIPPELRDRFVPETTDAKASQRSLTDVDRLISEHFGYSEPEIAALVAARTIVTE